MRYLGKLDIYGTDWFTVEVEPKAYLPKSIA